MVLRKIKQVVLFLIEYTWPWSIVVAFDGSAFPLVYSRTCSRTGEQVSDKWQNCSKTSSNTFYEASFEGFLSEKKFSNTLSIWILLVPCLKFIRKKFHFATFDTVRFILFHPACQIMLLILVKTFTLTLN